MDDRLLDLFEIELRHLQGMLQEFRTSNEKIAGRMLIDQDGRCQDPWVQRLLEGFAFLAARVHRRLDDEFPRFTEGLIETIYPQFLAPVPSAGIFEFRPDGSVPDLMQGREIPRGTLIRNRVKGGEGAGSVCTFLTTQTVRLTSLLLRRIRYVSQARLESLRLPKALSASAHSALVLGLTNQAAAPIHKVKADGLDFFIAASGETRAMLIELLLAGCLGWAIRDPENSMDACVAWSGRDAGEPVTPLGFTDDEAMLPTDPRGFSGLRLLREYLNLPERFQFFKVRGLTAGLSKCLGKEAELLLVFDREMLPLARLVDEDSKEKGKSVAAVKLYCTPAVNLFPKEMLRVSLADGTSELRLIADRFKDLEFEVHSVERVEGIGDRGQRQIFRPFFEVTDKENSLPSSTGSAFFTVRRSRRAPTLQEKEVGAMRSYAGSTVYLSVVDGFNAPHHPDLRELKVQCLCSNRHLPRELPADVWLNELVASPSPPYLKEVVLLGQVSEPQLGETEGQNAWKFISHLAMNLTDLSVEEGPLASGARLREVLKLQLPPSAISARHQIEGLRGVRVEPDVGRLVRDGMTTFVRGHKVILEIDENAFRGHSPVLFGAVLARFLARHSPLNSFTETILWSIQRQQEIIRWRSQLDR